MKTVVKVQLLKPMARRGTPQMGIFLECLRYMGVIKLYEPEDEYRYIFYIYPPQGIVKASHAHWAESNVQRMKTFGVVASVEQITI